MKSAVMSMTATPDRSYAGSPTMVWLVFKERILLPLRQATHSKQRKAQLTMVIKYAILNIKFIGTGRSTRIMFMLWYVRLK